MPPEQDFGEKTEPATPRKRQEARERGQVAKSNDLCIAVLLLGAFGTLFLLGEHMARDIGRLARDSFADVARFDFTATNVMTLFREKVLSVASIMAPFALVMAVVAFFVHFLQIGPIWSKTALAPDIERLSPVRGFKRIFSVRGMIRVIMGVGKLAIIGIMLYLILTRYVDPGESTSLFALLMDNPAGAFVKGKTAACQLGLICAAAMLVLAILDFAYQKMQHEKELRMSRQEVREELKRYEGDPKHKERRRRMQRQILFQRYQQEVPKADVVVTNPTHYAVAIAYDPGADAAPRVVAKGEGLLAQRIREVAMMAEVPVIERPVLARSLYRVVEVGQEIPHELYETVAEVLAYVWRLSGKQPERVA